MILLTPAEQLASASGENRYLYVIACIVHYVFGKECTKQNDAT